MSQHFRGSKQAIRQRTIERYNPRTGYKVEHHFKSFDLDRIHEKARQYGATGSEYEVVSENGAYSLVATLPDYAGGQGVQIVIDTWEIAVSQLSITWTKHPLVLAMLDRSGDAATVARGIKQAVEGTEAYSDIDDLAPLDNADEEIMFRLLDMARLGKDSFRDYSYTLRHTTNASSAYASNVADWNVNYIYTNAQLLSEAQSGVYWIYPLPGRLSAKIQAIATDYLADWGAQNYHQVGWLKSASSEATAADNRINIATEYTFGQWSTDLYLYF